MSLDVLKANRIAGSVYIEPNETLYDPVSKMRVSTPSNLIDTDFEYGLQSTKWETLELINNIPTFFIRDGESSIVMTSMTASVGSNVISVTCSEAHNFSVGNVIIVKGASLAFADGTYVVLTTPTTTTFTYRAKRASPITGSVLETTTELYLANLYQGTEFRLENLGAIQTDGQATSSITVNTKSPHGFKAGSTFILLNSLTSQEISFDSRLVTELNYVEKQASSALDEPITIDPNNIEDFAWFEWGTVSSVDPGSAGMTNVDITGQTDTGIFSIQFPTGFTFKAFDARYDRIYVAANSAVGFSNSVDAPAFFPSHRPLIEVFGNGDNSYFNNGWTLTSLKYQTATNSLRVRWEGYQDGDGNAVTTMVWEMFFDCTTDIATFRLYSAPSSNYSYTPTFRIYGPTNEATAIATNLTDFVDTFTKYYRELTFRLETQDYSLSPPIFTGYNVNTLDFDNTSKFNHYYWTGARTVTFDPDTQGSIGTKPSLWFALGKNTDESWTASGVRDTNYITKIENNVITFNQPHGLVDGRPYLYVPGVLNGGLTIAGAQVTAPTIYHIRTKATQSGAGTGYTLGDGVYTSVNTTATNTTVTTNLITVTSTAAMNVNSPIVFLGTGFGGLTSGRVYYIRTINSATQLTVSETLDGNGRAGSVVSLTTATGSMVAHIGAIITDPTRQLILTNRTAVTIPLTVNFGVQAAAARFPLATDRYGPHAFLNATRIHFHDVTAAGANGNGYPIAALDAAYTMGDIVGQDIPVCIFTATGSGAATAPTGTTASTNNYNSTTSTIYYIRNINSNTLTFGTVGTLAQRQSNFNTTTSNATTTAIALAAETVTLTVPQASLNDIPNFVTGMIGHEVEFTAPAALVGIRGFVTAHTGTTTRTFTVKLIKPVDVAIGAQTSVVGVQWYGSGSRTRATFNLSTSAAGAIQALSGANYESYIVPIVHPNQWSTRQSWYMKNHQFQTNNIVLYENSTTNATAIPTGLTNTTYYRAEVVDVDRFRLLNDAGTALNYTAMAGAVPFKTWLKDYSNTDTDQSVDTVSWLWSVGAVAANGTASTITFPPPAYKNADNITIPTTASGVNTFTITSTTRFIGGAGNVAHHGGRIKFYNPRLRSDAQITAGDYPDDDFKLNDGSSINNLDIRIGAITGTAPAVSIVCYVMDPGGLPSGITTLATVKAIIETGMSIRDEDQLTGISSWCRDKWLNNRDNAIYPHVGSVFADLYESSLIPRRQLETGSVTAVTAADPISVTYTMPSNQVSIIGASRTSNIATITTAVPHYFKEGQTVTVAGVTDATFNNASAVIINTTMNTFTYSNAGTNATSTNGTASQLIPAIAPKLATISGFTRANPAVVTTAAAHGLVNSQAFHFQGLLGDWSSLWNEKVYYAKVLTTTTFEVYTDLTLTQSVDTQGFASAYVQGTHAGRIWALGAKFNSKAVSHTFTTRVSDVFSDTIFSTGHGLNAGTLVTYSTGGGTAPGGLTAGDQRYVFEPTANNFRLATTSTGWSTAAIAFTQNGTNVNTTTGVFTTPTHGFTTGKQVQYLSTTPVTGLENGAFYWVRADSATTCTLYWTQTGAQNNLAAERIKMLGTPTGTGSLRQAEVVDITTEGIGTTHKVTTATTVGAIDGLYEIADPAPSGNTSAFTLTNPTGAFIPKRTIAFNSSNGIDLFNSAFYSPTHGLVTGTPIVYQLGNASTAPADLVDGTTYYAIRTNANYFRVALTQSDANSNIFININSTTSKGGSGTHEFEVGSVVGATPASGTLTLTGGSKNILGTNTAFTSYFRSGDHFTFTWANPSANTTRTFTFSGATCTNTSAAPFNTTHGLLTGMSVIFNSTITAPTGLTNGFIYYVRYVAANTFQLHPTYDDAVNNTNAISPTGGSGTFSITISYCAETGTEIIDYVNSRTKMVLKNAISISKQAKYPVSLAAAASTTLTVTFPFTHGLSTGNIITFTGTGNAVVDNIAFVIATTPAVNTLTVTLASAQTVTATTTVGQYAYSFPTATFDATSSLLLRSDSSAVHRPFDGGVEIVSSRTPDSQMIRQTRRYFRYQSGKGIQVSFAINFSPSVMINSVVGLGNGLSRVTTRVSHALSAGVQITIFNDTNSNFNGTYTVSSVVDDYVFDIATGYTTSSSSGRPEFYVNSWSDSVIRCGLFDDQNGMFFEFDGSILYCVRRNSTTQLGGTATVQFNSNIVLGTGTNYSGELAAGDMVVIRGQSYKVTEVPNTTTFYIQPAYRGSDSTNVVLSKTIDLRVPQSSWNEDTLNGSGPTGYNLNKYAIQMAYMDYSWYGAGKVRFGFKDQNGIVRYVHNFIHNNLEREAYLRSGNLPARYEVKTGPNPTYVPKLAHWGTSVIMDGGFDDDKAYFFSALSNQITATSTIGNNISVTGSNITQLTRYIAYDNGGKQLGEIGFAIVIPTKSDTYKAIASNVSITGNGLAAGTLTALPTMGTVNGQSRPYLEDIRISPSSSTRVNLLVINQAPASTQTGQTYTVSNPELVSGYIPLLSLRLAPSVDNGVPGGLGAREIINRMQLALAKLDVLSTHEVEVSLVFNPTLDNLNWSKVSSPSLSQVIYHSIADTVTGGTQILSFQCPQGSQLITGTSAQRSFALTSIDLREIATLGNSILGGDGVFPDGPDLLTLRFRYTGDGSQIGPGVANSSQSPFRLSTRLSWTESQA